MKYTVVKGYGELKAGDQIATAGLLKDLHPSLKVLYKLVSEKNYYFHHGIYMGDFTVVDFHGKTKSDAKPRQVDIKEFDNGLDRLLFRVDYEEGETTLLPDETIQKARDLITSEKCVTGDKSEKWPTYNVLWNNCETMAAYLKTGTEKLSQQASMAALRCLKFLAAGAVVVGGGSSIGATVVGGSIAMASKAKST